MTRWEHILSLYNQLIVLDYSPIVALNRAVALAKVNGHQQAIAELEPLRVNRNGYYHQVLGYLYTTLESEKALTHYEKAHELMKSIVEKRMIAKEIERLLKAN